jgi:hypothetical protein
VEIDYGKSKTLLPFEQRTVQLTAVPTPYSNEMAKNISIETDEQSGSPHVFRLFVFGNKVK